MYVVYCDNKGMSITNSSLIGKILFVNLYCKFTGGCRLIGPEEIRGRLLIIYSFTTSIGLKIRTLFCLTKEGLLSRPIAIAFAIASFLLYVVLSCYNQLRVTLRREPVSVVSETVINIRPNPCSTTLLFPF